MRTAHLLPLLFCNALIAQTWAPIGATWTYTYAVDDIIDPAPPVYSSYALTVTGDTTINGQVCSRAEGSALACHMNTGFIYQSNDSVFLWDQNVGSFALLYRWDAGAGESWTVPITGLFGSDTLTYTVNAIGTITINGQLRRTLDVQLWDQLGYAFTGGQLIEGIGDTGYLFPWYTALCGGFTMGPLRCYEDTGLGLYMAPGITQCGIPTIVGAFDNAPSLQVAPSLVNSDEIVSVTTTSSGSIGIDVRDALGRTILVAALNDGRAEFSITTPGSYTISVAGGTRRSFRRLVVR